MYKARYYKADGKKGRARALPEALFDGVVNEGVMHQAVKAYLSNQRQGTASAKTRSDVQGGNSTPWRQRVPKKVRALARRSALNDRAGSDRIVLADLPKMDAPRTKDLVAWVSALGAGGKVLLLTHGKNENVYLSSRNVPGLAVLPFGEESAYDLLWAETVAIERSALEAGDGAAEASEAEEESDG